MTRRSILTGKAPDVIIKAGGSVTVKGHESDRVMAETMDRWGLKVEQHSQSEVARARAAVGEHVLFDLRLKLPRWEGKDTSGEVTEIQIVGSGEVSVPLDSNLKIYAGKDIDVQGIRGQVDAYSGHKLSLRAVNLLGHASAGWSMNLNCLNLVGSKVEYKAGSDIRFQIQDLTSARIRVKDISGYWEGLIGRGERSVYLKCGGDVTIVTGLKVEPLPPNYILGKIEKPTTQNSDFLLE